MSHDSAPQLVALSNLLWDIYSIGSREIVVGQSADAARITRMMESDFDRLVQAVRSNGLSYEGIGGSATNVAIAFSSLGGDAVVAGPLGDSAHGRRVVAELQRHDVHLLKLEPPPERDGYCICFPRANGERSFSVQLPEYQKGEVVASLQDDRLAGRFLVVTAYELEDPVMREFVIESLSRAATQGMDIVFDCGDSAFVERHAATVWQIIRLGPAVLVMDDESRAVLLESGGGPQNSTDPFSAFARHIVVTRGTHGAEITGAGELIRSPARETTVVDTTGAGDALLAGLLWGLSCGCTAGRSLDLGLAAAAEAVATLGPHLSRDRWYTIRSQWEVSG